MCIMMLEEAPARRTQFNYTHTDAGGPEPTIDQTDPTDPTPWSRGAPRGPPGTPRAICNQRAHARAEKHRAGTPGSLRGPRPAS